jgi:adenylate kinase family enzyme
MQDKFRRVIIFGRPGSGKSTFAAILAKSINLPLYHLDKFSSTKNWLEADSNKFLSTEQSIVNESSWIIDGNHINSLEMRFKKADLALYFNFPKTVCYWRIFKRFFKPNKEIDDRAPGCEESITLYLLQYIWNFEKLIAEKIDLLKTKYPNVTFKEINSQHDLTKLKNQLLAQSTKPIDN